MSSSAEEAHRLHGQLARRNELRLRPALTGEAPITGEAADEWMDDLADRRLEERFIAEERAAVAPLLRQTPPPAREEGFVSWFEGLRADGPGQRDPLFPWLAERATLDQLRWFLTQEVAGEAGFEDLLALTQLKMPTRAKLEMARNFWDELGRGHQSGMHGPMLERLSAAMGVHASTETPIWPARALANLMVGLAWNRRYAFQSIGALGVIELTAPERAAHVNAGLTRLGVSPRDRQYFALHATLDVRHSAAWTREVLRPLVAAEPECAHAIAEGALLRLRAGARCFAHYRAHLGVGPGGNQPSAVSLAWS